MGHRTCHVDFVLAALGHASDKPNSVGDVVSVGVQQVGASVKPSIADAVDHMRDPSKHTLIGSCGLRDFELLLVD